MRFKIIVLLLSFVSAASFAQLPVDSLQGVTLIASDKIGNCYAVLQSEVIKFSPEGKRMNNFSRKDFGPVSQIDVRDPLRIHLFYRDFGMVRILDNQLGETSVLDLRTAGVIAPVVIANAVDGGIWVYESINNQLLKYDDRVQQQLLAINMFQFSGKPLNPLLMQASDNWLVLLTSDEIYLFDRFGNYARTIALKEKTKLLRMEDQVLWYSDSTGLTGLNLKLNTEKKIPYNTSADLQIEYTSSAYWILTPEHTIKRIPVN